MTQFGDCIDITRNGIKSGRKQRHFDLKFGKKGIGKERERGYIYGKCPLIKIKRLNEYKVFLERKGRKGCRVEKKTK